MEEAKRVREEVVDVGLGVECDEVIVDKTVCVDGFDGLGMEYAWVYCIVHVMEIEWRSFSMSSSAAFERRN